jgi:hypothetical protein
VLTCGYITSFVGGSVGVGHVSMTECAVGFNDDRLVRAQVSAYSCEEIWDRPAPPWLHYVPPPTRDTRRACDRVACDV